MYRRFVEIPEEKLIEKFAFIDKYAISYQIITRVGIIVSVRLGHRSENVDIMIMIPVVCYLNSIQRPSTVTEKPIAVKICHMRLHFESNQLRMVSTPQFSLRA